jgi:hypothetical protein
MSEENLKVPARSLADGAHAVVKAVLSTVPVVGGPAVELFQYVVQPALEKRREEWMRNVGTKLEELGCKGLDLSSLHNNKEFISIVMQASQVALRTHNTEKLAALRNAVINVACGQSPDETVQHILLGLIDQLSEMHLRILKAFHAPVPPPGMSMGGLDSVLQHNIPGLNGQQELSDKLWKDLYMNGLINTDNMHITMSERGLAERRTTLLGESLLNFISERA